MSGENINRRNFLKYFSVGLGLVILGGAAYYLSQGIIGGKEEKKGIRAYFVPSTSVDEPWVGVVHRALLKARDEYGIEYSYTEHLAGGYQQVPAAIEEAIANGYNLIFADVFGCEEEARNIAKDHKDIYFVYGSGLSPMDPNVSVFDNWIHEPAYLCGYIAGALTESGKLGVVAAMEIEEVNRLVNAFKIGAAKYGEKYDKDIQVGIRYINSWFDPPKAADRTEELISLGADVIYAERYGVFSVAKSYKIPVFGNLLDQWKESPEIVVTGPEWDMWPTVSYVIDMIKKGAWVAQDLKDWSMMAKGGAKLAGWPELHDWRNRLYKHIVEKLEETKVLDEVGKMIDEILNGTLRVPIVEGPATTDF